MGTSCGTALIFNLYIQYAIPYLFFMEWGFPTTALAGPR